MANTMNPKFTFKHLEPLESIKQFAESRIAKLDKYSLHKDSKVHFIFSVQKQDQVAEIMVDAGGAHYTAVAKDEILYNAIDRVVEKVERQLMKHKEKVQDHRTARQLNHDEEEAGLPERFAEFRENIARNVKKRSS